MPRSISTVGLQNMNAVSTAEGWLFLMELRVEDGTTYYVVNNNTNVTSGGQVYTAYAFAIIMNQDDGESLPSFQIAIDNVDMMFIESIRGFVEPPTVILSLVPISDPDSPEIVTPRLTMRDVQFDAFQITGTLMAGDTLNQRFPKARYTPQNVPGLF